MDLKSLIFWRRPDRCAKCAEYEDAIAHLTSIDYKADGVHPTVANAAFDGAAVKLFAASAVQWFKDTGGKNFVTLDMNDPKTGEHYEVTMQKAGGMTPAQKLGKLQGALAQIRDGKTIQGMSPALFAERVLVELSAGASTESK